MYELARAEPPGPGRPTTLRDPRHPSEGWESLFRTVLEHAGNPIALVDEDRRMLEINPAAAAVTGYSRGEVVGRLADDYLPKHERERFAREWRELLLGGDTSGARDMVRADGATMTIEYRAVRRIVDGRRIALYLVTGVRGALQGESPEPAADDQIFSPREREIVRLVADGHTTRAIADELGLSLETIRTHIRNAMGKLRTRTRAQLVAKALGERLI